MPERSLRIPPGTPPNMVIAAFNGLADRMDVIEGKRTSLDLKAFAAALDDEVDGDEEESPRLTPADVQQAVEHAVKETRSGIPDATARWTLHLGPGCVVVNDETGNHFLVEPGNAVKLDADVKLAVLDKAEKIIDPDAKAKVDPMQAVVDRLRKALIDTGNILGARLGEGVSTDLLMNVPREAGLVVQRLKAERDQARSKSVPIHDVRVIQTSRTFRGSMVWPVRLNTAITANSIVRDIGRDGEMCWVSKVVHDVTEGFSNLTVVPLTD